MRKRPTNIAATGRSASAERPSPSGLSTLGGLAGATPSGVALVSTCQAYVCVFRWDRAPLVASGGVRRTCVFRAGEAYGACRCKSYPFRN